MFGGCYTSRVGTKQKKEPWYAWCCTGWELGKCLVLDTSGLHGSVTRVCHEMLFGSRHNDATIPS